MESDRHREELRRPFQLGLLSWIATMTLVICLPAARAGRCDGSGQELGKLFHFEIQTADRAVAPELEADVAYGRKRIEQYFGMTFRQPVIVRVLPSRKAFTASFPASWGMPETACWMVAAGVADRLLILSPTVWEKEACEHDPHDAQHVRDIVVHELVHVFHGQHNPTRDFTGAEEVGWFAEGLAVHVSGQLHHGHLAEPREAVERGLGPKRLANAWSGKYRYGVCGSLVAYIEQKYGRGVIRKLLPVTRQKELLKILGTSEQELLADWQRWVMAQSGKSPGSKSPPQ